jgi:hypothetical protein
MARERSEDALTWNVFRYLQTTGYLPEALSSLLDRNLGQLELVYWSHSAESKGLWADLEKARKVFGEGSRTGSEPDLILFNDRVLVFLEAKFTASNATRPSSSSSRQGYETGENCWYNRVFTSGYDTIANAEGKYELMRFWLLGSWIADRSERDFVLVNLTRCAQETDVEAAFGKHLQPDTHRSFRRATWEEIYQYVATRVPLSQDKACFMGYMEHKTAGYDRLGNLQRAFSMP